MIDSGLMVHWRAKFWPPEDACSLKTDGDITVKPVNVMDMTGIFFILGCGKTNNIYNSIKYRIINSFHKSLFCHICLYFDFRLCVISITVDGGILYGRIEANYFTWKQWKSCHYSIFNVTKFWSKILKVNLVKRHISYFTYKSNQINRWFSYNILLLTFCHNLNMNNKLYLMFINKVWTMMKCQ